MTRSMISLTLVCTSALLFACGRGGPPEGEGSLGGGDGGADGGGTDTGVAPVIVGLRGSAEVAVGLGGSYTGTEDLYYQTLDGSDVCVVRSEVTNTSPPPALCASCDWAFGLSTANSTVAESSACPTLDPSDFDGAEFGYGYADFGKYGVMYYYYTGYGWYGVAYADFDGSTFSYDWPINYAYLY